MEDVFIKALETVLMKDKTINESQWVSIRAIFLMAFYVCLNLAPLLQDL